LVSPPNFYIWLLGRSTTQEPVKAGWVKKSGRAGAHTFFYRRFARVLCRCYFLRPSFFTPLKLKFTYEFILYLKRNNVNAVPNRHGVFLSFERNKNSGSVPG
jgi:hypothetical protein